MKIFSAKTFFWGRFWPRIFDSEGSASLTRNFIINLCYSWGSTLRTPRFFHSVGSASLTPILLLIFVIREAPHPPLFSFGRLPQTPFSYDRREGSGEPPNGFADAERRSVSYSQYKLWLSDFIKKY